jgi:putrescine transport system permease protein
MAHWVPRGREEAALSAHDRRLLFWESFLGNFLFSICMLFGVLLTFTLSLDDVVLSQFLSGPGATTMPLVIFSRARLGLNPSVNAIATLIITLVSIGVIAASAVIARRERIRLSEVAAAARAG